MTRRFGNTRRWNREGSVVIAGKDGGVGENTEMGLLDAEIQNPSLDRLCTPRPFVVCPIVGQIDFPGFSTY
ncbi:MAG: hypothetical protein ACQER4_03380 [Bacteroidota bacterium]